MFSQPNVHQFIVAMPKVELHVHLEGSMPPETLLKLAKKHGIALPADTVEDIRAWYTFTNFPHFVEIYVAMSKCLQTVDDVEQLARDFLRGQAAQNILYTEVTYTPFTHTKMKGFTFRDQLDALNRARRWAEAELGVTMRYIFDIAREVPPEDGMITADNVIEAYHQENSGIVALGLGGYEVGNPTDKFAAAFAKTRAAGVPLVLHAGEHGGPASVRAALAQGSQRIGHGVQAVEDPALVAELARRQIPLEVCPTSNICLKVYPSLAEHPIQQLIEAGVIVTVNSDDPPMFNTTLTDEYLRCAETFGWNEAVCERLVMNAAHAVLLPQGQKETLIKRVEVGFNLLKTGEGITFGSTPAAVTSL